jgi:tRNA (guanine-N7-)-methyltransferase
MTEAESKLRRVRSFVRRDSRMTDGQRRVLESLWPQVGLAIEDAPVDLNSVFNRVAPKILEIGFGSGHSLFEIAKRHPEKDFIGVETHQPGIGALMLEIEKEAIQNIRIFYGDAVEVLQKSIAASSLDGIQLFFPDPWPKRKHHKRRIIQPDFVNLLVDKLKSNGVLHLATDWEHYAHHMMQVLSKSDKLVNIAGAQQFAARSENRPITTKFENRGTQSGRHIWELQFARCD